MSLCAHIVRTCEFSVMSVAFAGVSRSWIRPFSRESSCSEGCVCVHVFRHEAVVHHMSAIVACGCCAGVVV